MKISSQRLAQTQGSWPATASLQDVSGRRQPWALRTRPRDLRTSSLDARLLGTPDRLPAGVNATQVPDDCFAELDLLSSLPTIFIGEADGRTCGGGNDHFMRMDMRQRSLAHRSIQQLF